jgi:hypothetical protein
VGSRVSATTSAVTRSKRSSNDGQRFLVNTVVDQPTRPALTVVLNWTADLKKQSHTLTRSLAGRIMTGVPRSLLK